MPAARIPLNKGKTVALDATGAGTIQLGPDQGPPQWEVTKVVLRTSRPGVPPIPTATLYLNTQDEHGLQDVTYDGSFDSTDVALTVFRGAHLIVVWAGGQAGDVATMSVTGWQVTP